jgi:UDP-galactopyranose mutase
MVFENYDVEFFQTNSVINYPNEEDFTRITEFKYLTKEICGKTTILKEYPLEYKAESGLNPYYPIINAENSEKFKKYTDFWTVTAIFTASEDLRNIKTMIWINVFSQLCSLRKKIKF